MILLLVCFISLISYVYYHLKKKIKVEFTPDIVLSPGGYNGFYQLGICHYIKNHFTFDDKKIIGFSAGSWAGLFLCLHKDKSNECVRNIFKQINKCCRLSKIPSILKNAIEKYDYSDFNIKNLNIGMTNVHKKNICIHNDFLTIQDCVNSCIGSAFVPYVTYNDLVYFYKHKFVLDGAIYYKKFIKEIDTNKTLVISAHCFRSNYKKRVPFMGLKKPKRTLYDLYILGYNNARNNHAYIKKYLHSDS